ncbi:MAG: hypothetical protein MJ025_04745 [Victivallaceae bacterium]|nr:hypothetical protein [Victivallaceae bacterium]
MIIRETAYPRAALIGNPSDGYYGKTIAFVFANFHADIRLYETPLLTLVPNCRDGNEYSSVDALADDIGSYGYYGGIRLLKAAVKKLRDYCRAHGIRLPRRNFTLEYSSTIPNRLGLAGSSAIITAAMRGLLRFYDIESKMDPSEMANVVLAAERDELGIPAGLQDRVAQAFNHPVYMNFDRAYMEKHGVGIYDRVVIPDELNLYVAYRTDLSEGSEVLHSRLRYEYEHGVKRVVDAISEWASLTDRFRQAMDSGRLSEIPGLINRNFDLRREVCAGSISSMNLDMVSAARSVGASAKFTGSGGAIIGTYEDEEMYNALEKVLSGRGIKVIRPKVVYGK